jgi:ABC-2 type transport system permease protein
LSTKAPGAKQGIFGATLDSLSTLYDRRWLVRYMAQRQMVRSYRGSYLGMLWAFLTPLITVAFLTLIFSEMLGIRFREVTGDSSLNFGLFLYCGLVPFMAYSQALTKGVNIIRRNSNLVQGVRFPLEILPLTTVVATLIQNVIGIGVLVGILAVIDGRIHLTVLLLPLVFIPQIVFTLGLCYLMAVAGTYVPDVRETLRIVVRGTFFITPILFPSGRVPEEWSFLVDYNPLAVLVDSYRALILEGHLPSASGAVYFILVALVLFVAGFLVFNRTKHNFADLL